MRSSLALTLVAALVGGLIFGTGAWLARGWIADAKHANLIASHAQVMQSYADQASQAAQALIERQAEHQKTLAQIDARHTEVITHAYNEIDSLRAAVAAGERLRVNATCPAPAARVPAAAEPARVDDAAGPRLTDAAERDYFALRERIARADAMINGLQEYVRDVCLGGSNAR